MSDESQRDDILRRVEALDAYVRSNGTTPYPPNVRDRKLDRKRVLEEVHSLSDLRNMNVRDFVSAMKSCHNALEERHRMEFLELMVDNKIRGVAKTRIGTAIPATLDELIKKLWKAAADGESSESLRVKLDEAEQGTQSLENFVVRLEDIATKISFLEAIEQDTEYSEAQVEAVKNVYLKQALGAFKRGISKSYVRMAVTVANPPTLRRALSIAIAAKTTSRMEEDNFVGAYGPSRNAVDRNYDRKGSSSSRWRGSGNRNESGKYAYNNKNPNSSRNYNNSRRNRDRNRDPAKDRSCSRDSNSTDNGNNSDRGFRKRSPTPGRISPSRNSGGASNHRSKQNDRKN